MEEHRSGYRILIADDDENVHRSLNPYFKREGYQILSAHDGEEALDYVQKMRPDIVLLDIMMPKMDGLVVCREIRKESNLPIIMLTAKGEEFDKLLGLELGADDYITKPFNPMELVARVKSQLRRYTSLGDIHSSGENTIVNGRLTFNLDEHVLYADGEPVKLTATETKIVELLMRNPGRIFPAEEIYSKIWNESAYSTENTVMVHIRRIREKIEINPGEPEYLKVVWGIGYKFEKH